MTASSLDNPTTPRTEATTTMRLEGIHHVTCITGDAPGNVDFYTRVLGLRLVKKTVNQDDPTVYHLFYADERGSAGSDITFFEYPGARRGRAGAGMVHTVAFGSPPRTRSASGRSASPARASPRREARPAPLRGPRGPRAGARRRERARRAARRAASRDPRRARAARLRRRPRVLDRPRAEQAAARAGAGLLAEGGGAEWEVRGDVRGGLYAYDAPPAGAGVARRGHGPPRRVVVHDGGPRGVAAAGDRGGRAGHARHRPLLVSLGVLP